MRNPFGALRSADANQTRRRKARVWVARQGSSRPGVALVTGAARARHGATGGSWGAVGGKSHRRGSDDRGSDGDDGGESDGGSGGKLYIKVWDVRGRAELGTPTANERFAARRLRPASNEPPRAPRPAHGSRPCPTGRSAEHPVPIAITLACPPWHALLCGALDGIDGTGRDTGCGPVPPCRSRQKPRFSCIFYGV